MVLYNRGGMKLKKIYFVPELELDELIAEDVMRKSFGGETGDEGDIMSNGVDDGNY